MSYCEGLIYTNTKRQYLLTIISLAWLFSMKSCHLYLCGFQSLKLNATVTIKPHHCYLECWSMHHTSKEALLTTCVN